MGYFFDRLVGEPPAALHPVRGLGALMALAERAFYRPTRLAGAAYAAVGLAAGATVGLIAPWAALATYVTTAGKALEEAALCVSRALDEGDLGLARQLARSLVGRDTAALDEAEVVRAVVESVAENTNDAIVAPLVFALAFGAPGAYFYRVANTLDSLVGYRNARYEAFGWASARLDDLAGYVPARVTALAVAVLRPRRWRQVFAAVQFQAPAHPSPNAGVAEAAFAGALGLSLGGANSYAGVVEHRPVLGEGPRPARGDIERAVRLSRDVGAAVALAALFGSVLAQLAREGSYLLAPVGVA
jgi:adenosylcobinamide-phosphate synthase